MSVSQISDRSGLERLLQVCREAKNSYTEVGFPEGVGNAPKEASNQVGIKEGRIAAFSIMRETLRSGGTKKLAKRRGRTAYAFAYAGTRESARGSTLATVAATHEYGSVSKGIPARPFMKPAFGGNGARRIASMQRKVGEAIVLGNITLANGLGLLGELGTSLVKSAITAVITPPLSATTIKRKKSSKPLIDTGQMRNSVTHSEVVNGRRI